MAFKVGDVVVCTAAAYPHDKDYPLTIGAVYKVSDGITRCGSIRLEGFDGWWSAWQFEPVLLENV